MAIPMPGQTNQQVWDLIKEIDDYIKENSVGDWELDFISDMMDLRQQKRSCTVKQREHVCRIWEKYCL